MNLVIDIGNTFVKLAVFQDGEIIYTTIEKDLTENTLAEVYERFNIQYAISSSVSSNKNVLKKYNILSLTHNTALPLQLNYTTPETLGLDRLAAVMGAKVKCGNNFLVIDMGTCVTFDYVNSNNEYLGGAISPGFTMRFKALNTFTEKLPLVNFDKGKLKLVGDSTENSIISGVYNGLKHEIEGVINEYIQQYSNVKIVVTGGDRNLFDLEPKNRIFADEFLVLKGLNEILNYNEEK